jgi:hypothetical protein
MVGDDIRAGTLHCPRIRQLPDGAPTKLDFTGLRAFLHKSRAVRWRRSGSKLGVTDFSARVGDVTTHS